jgi:hypothetical protein
MEFDYVYGDVLLRVSHYADADAGEGVRGVREHPAVKSRSAGSIA